jgi:hypothetical protein
LSLSVSATVNCVAAAFEEYTEREQLDGDNRYRAEGHGST